MFLWISGRNSRPQFWSYSWHLFKHLCEFVLKSIRAEWEVRLFIQKLAHLKQVISSHGTFHCLFMVERLVNTATWNIYHFQSFCIWSSFRHGTTHSERIKRNNMTASVYCWSCMQSHTRRDLRIGAAEDVDGLKSNFTLLTLKAQSLSWDSESMVRDRGI